MRLRGDRPSGTSIFGVADDQVLGVVLVARRVRHDVAQRDRLAERLGHLEVEVRVDVGVEVELALLDQLHDRGPGEELRDRAGAEERRLPVDGDALLDVGEAVALAEEDLAVLDDDDDGARDVRRAELRRHDAVEERLDVGGRHRRRRPARAAAAAAADADRGRGLRGRRRRFVGAGTAASGAPLARKKSAEEGWPTSDSRRSDLPQPHRSNLRPNCIWRGPNAPAAVARGLAESSASVHVADVVRRVDVVEHVERLDDQLQVRLARSGSARRGAG